MKRNYRECQESNPDSLQVSQHYPNLDFGLNGFFGKKEKKILQIFRGATFFRGHICGAGFWWNVKKVNKHYFSIKRFFYFAEIPEYFFVSFSNQLSSTWFHLFLAKKNFLGKKCKKIDDWQKLWNGKFKNEGTTFESQK